MLPECSDRSLLVDRLFARLRETERVARVKLKDGCAADIATLAKFLERPLQAARTEAIEAMMGMGKPRDADLVHSLRLDMFESIGMRCAERVRVNVEMRFRARFKLYAEEFLKGEELIIKALDLRTNHLFPRIFTVGHLSLDTLLPPRGPNDDSEAELTAWIERLRQCIQNALLVEIDAARQNVLGLGMKRLGIIRMRLRLAESKIDD